jgi:hypothetical protein
MNKKRFLAVVLTVLFAAGAAIITGHTQPTTQLRQANEQIGASQQTADVPDQIFYGEMLTILARLQNVGDYQTQAGLTDEQAEFLTRTAEQCAARIARQDEIAQTRIATLQQGLRSNSSRSRPAVPAEISQLQAQRDDIILKCRDVLRDRFGEPKFEQFSRAAKSIVQIRASRVR